MKNSKKRKRYIMEQQDAQGISRKHWNRTISLKLFVFLKIICIVSIPIFYFVYSPLLIVCLAGYVSLFFLAILAERRINTSVIKSSHIKIFKFDSAVALIIILIALLGTFTTSTSKVKSANFADLPNTQITEFIKNKDFAGARHNTWLNSFTTGLKNFGSVLTGERSIFGDGKRQFGMKEPPKDFPTDMKDVDFGDFDFSNKPFGDEPSFSFSMDDVPVEYMFSSILSTINTVLVFSVSGMGIISLIILYRKKQKRDYSYAEVITTNNEPISDEELNRILDFGETVKDNYEDINQNTEIIKKQENNDTKTTNNINTNIDDKQNGQQEIIKDDKIEILDNNFALDKVFDEYTKDEQKNNS